MTTLVVSQPMFFPWRGWFEQIRLADVVVFYDDVQLPSGGGRGRSFMTRVQIKTPRGPSWLSVPIRRSGRGAQLICDAHFANSDWKRSHLGMLRASYLGAPAFEDVLAHVVEPAYAFAGTSLSEFCTNATRLIADYLTLPSSSWKRSSEMNVRAIEDPTQRLLELCRRTGARHYITGHGAANYLRHELFEDAGVRVSYVDYGLAPYPQRFGAFTPYVSVLDLLFNVGRDANSYLDANLVDWKTWLRRRAGCE